MPAFFRLTLITPEGVFIDERIESLVIPCENGERGIMRGHENLIAAIYPGELRYRSPAGLKRVFVSHGYAHITGKLAVVVSNAAEWPEDIDVERAEEGIERARARLNNPATTPHVRHLAEQALQRQSKRIEVARRRARRQAEHDDGSRDA